MKRRSISGLIALLAILFFAVGSDMTVAQEDCPRVETRVAYDSLTGTIRIVNVLIPCEGEEILDPRIFGQDEEFGAQPEDDYSTANPHVDPDEIQIEIVEYDKIRKALDELYIKINSMEKTLASMKFKSTSKKKVYAAELKLNELYALERKYTSDLNFLSESLFVLLLKVSTQQ